MKLKAYQEIINSTRMPKQDRVAGIAESATSGALADSMAKLDGVLGDAAKVGLPVGLIIKKLGAKKIANNLENHIDAELHHVGKFILFEENFFHPGPPGFTFFTKFFSVSSSSGGVINVAIIQIIVVSNAPITISCQLARV